MLANPAISNMTSEVFEETINQVIEGFQVRATPGTTQMRGVFSTEQVCGLQTAHVACSVMGVTRNPRSAGRKAERYYLLIHQDEGHAVMRQGSATRRLKTGDIMLVDTTKELDFTFFGSYQRQVVMHIPQEELQDKAQTTGDLDLYLPGTHHLAAALRNVIAEGLDWAGTDDASLLKDALLTLTTVGIHHARTSPTAGPRTRRQATAVPGSPLERMLAFMDAHFTQADLTLADIAAAVELSSRQAQRVMEPLGASPLQYLLGKRLERATELLSDAGTEAKTTIASIAFESGFGDVSHFNRKFREAFGISPRDWRRSQHQGGIGA